jgi:urea transporter
MTDGRTFAAVAALLAIAGLIATVVGQWHQDIHVQLSGLAAILCGLVLGLVSFRDFR